MPNDAARATKSGLTRSAAEQAPAELLLLGALDVAEGVVVEDDRDDVEAVLALGRQLPDRVQEATVAGERDHLASGLPTCAPSAVANAEPSVPW